MTLDLSTLLTGGSTLTVAAILIKGLVDWGTSRRVRRAQDEVAEGTVASTITEKSYAAQDAQIVVLCKQLEEERRSYDAERASYERRLTGVNTDYTRVASERDALLSTVDRLRTQIAALQDQLDEVRHQLDAVQDSIGDNHHPHTGGTL